MTGNVTVTVNPLPTATATAGGLTTFCSGSSVNINANTGAGLTYQWKNSSGNIANATNFTYNAVTADTYYTIVTNSNSCTNTSNSISVTVNPLPHDMHACCPTTFCLGSSVNINADTVSGLDVSNGRTVQEILLMPLILPIMLLLLIPIM